VGLAVVTDQRVVFQGNLRSHEWEYRKVSGLINNADEPWTSIIVAGRGRVSGIRYDWARAAEFRFHLAWGLALFKGNTAPLLASLRAELEFLGPRPNAETAWAPPNERRLPPTAPPRGVLDEIAEQIDRGDYTG
jgi:hypothetical protein